MNIFIYLIIFYSVLPISLICSASENTHDTLSALSSIEKAISVDKKLEVEIEPTISFNYNNEPLVNIINFIAQEKKINIIMPQGAASIKEKTTYVNESLLTVDQAWELLITLLDIADYMVVVRNNEYQIIKKTPEALREPMPLFIGVKADKLPITDETIRYLCYLSNIKVSVEPDHEINIVLRELLSPTGLFRIDPATNSLLIIDKASKIRDIMDIIERLDQVSFQEKMESLTLYHSEARIVADLLNEGLLKSADQTNRYNLDARKQNEGSFFARGTKVIPAIKSNSLIIIGRAQAVDRIVTFVKEHIDCELESGKSILHMFELQYLNAAAFETVLKKVVEASRTGGTGQSKAGEGVVKGTERFFDEVIIRSDKPLEEGDDRKYWGGNKIIVACRNEDAKQIEKLIEELDTPQPQVLLEVLVADLSIDDTRALGAMTRNPEKIPILNTMQFQAAHLDPSVVLDKATNPTTVASDLLAPVFDENRLQVDPAAGNKSVASFAVPGSSLISLNDNDGKTWNITQILKKFTTSRVLSHPHVIATNNKPALVRTGEERLLRDEASESSGGAAVIKFKKISAELRVEITPRISSADTVNLQVKVTINDFITGTNAQTTREVSTNANIKNGAIFALGGLISVRNNQSSNQTPGLSQIPGLGWLFKKRQGQLQENNLTVFISPTIIQPRLRRGQGNYTQDYIEVAKKYAQEGALFDSLKDPITRWFFQPNSPNVDVEAAIETFVEKDDLKMTVNKLAPPSKKPAPELKKTTVTIDQPLQNRINPLPKEITTDASTMITDPTNVAIQTHELPGSTIARVATQQTVPMAAPSAFNDLKTLLKDDPNPFLKG